MAGKGGLPRELSMVKEVNESDSDNERPKTPKKAPKKKTTTFNTNKVAPATQPHQPSQPTAEPRKSILHHNRDHVLRYAAGVDLPKGQNGNSSDESGMYSEYESDLEGGRRVQMAIANSNAENYEQNIRSMDELIKPEMEVPKVKENKLPLQIAKNCYDLTDGIFKIFFAALLFCIILTCLIVSNGCLLFIASQMNLDVRFRRAGFRPDTLFDVDWGISADNENITGDSCGVPECRLKPNADCAEREAVPWIWGMYMAQCLGYAMVFARSLWKVCFKKREMPSCSVLLWAMIPETLTTIGTFMLLHMLLPHWDVTRGLFVLSAIAFIPSLLQCFNNPWGKKSTVFKVLDIIATVIQGSAMFIWLITTGVVPVPLNEGGNGTLNDVCQNLSKKTSVYSFSSGLSTELPPPQAPYSYLLPADHQLPETVSDIWCLPLALLFISVDFWQNFIDRFTKKLGKFGSFLIKFRKEHAGSKTKINLILTPYKMALTLLLFTLYYEVHPQMELDRLFSSTHFYNNGDTCGDQHAGSFQGDWLAVVGILWSSAIVCLCASDLAIQAKLQVVSFTVPLVLSTPLTYALLLTACSNCQDWDFGTVFYWNCFSGHNGYNETLKYTYGYFGFFWWISMLWVVRHLWQPKLERLAMLDKIFVQSFPSVVFLEQSLMLTRRRNDQEVQKPKHKENKTNEKRKKSIANAHLNASKVPTMTKDKLGVPFIYMCATMWHETQDEMITMLISIFRMNKDQCARYANKYIHNLDDPDYYEFEVDIYFDDAFKKHPDDDSLVMVNDYVKDFIASMDKAASVAYNVGVILTPPTKFETPYGGRMEWKLPLTNNKVVLHLKDKTKIRNKKRWSQVMYMKSLLGRGIESQKAEPILKDYVARNTFVLALDGDIDFQPEAVLHLVDLMRRDHKVAAACGRIHPTGSGPMVWYQKFEYSISHWLQKSTEHMFGCVLCSPGCFSLFRASALIDDKIPDIYATVAKDPINFVQFDQGEDRWLCTLLIQHGHRIEYSAAADAFTNAPEEFNEFFNQRRRWITSTFANLLDIIGNGIQIAKNNESVSLLYMLYQLILFVSSIVGPATIFLLICGSFELVFGLDAFWAAIVGIVPVVIFMVLCYKTKTSTQLAYASVLTVIYAVLQMVVLAGMLRVMVDEGLCGSSTIFFLFIVGTFFLAAISHPFESTNILHSFIFYLFIPSAYLLLIVYSLCNVNQISWGTRENKTPGQEKKEQKKGVKKMMSYFGIESNEDGGDGEDDCCDGLICCTHRRTEDRLTSIEAQLIVMNSLNPDKNKANTDKKNKAGKSSPREATIPTIAQAVENITYRGHWIDDPDLGTGDRHSISHEETRFWKTLIQNTLPPEDPNSDEQKRIKQGLKDLRNKAVFAFFIIDMLMIAFILALKMSADYGMEDGIMITYTCSIDGDSKEHSLDPIGFSFIAVFGLLMVIQIIGMLLHRMFTFVQYVSTVIMCRTPDVMSNINHETAAKRKMSYHFSKEMQRFDFQMEQDETQNYKDGDDSQSQAGSQLSLKDDYVPQKPTALTYHRRESYSQVEMEKINMARQEALNRFIRKTQKQPANGRKTSKRKESVFQPVVDSIKQRKSVFTAPDAEVININDEALINKETKVVSKILEPK